MNKSDLEDEEKTPAPPSRFRRNFRLAQVAIYACLSAAMLVWTQLEKASSMSLTALSYLLVVYMAARALAIYLKYKQEFSPPRYTRAYIEAHDLIPASSASAPQADIPQNGHSNHVKNGSNHG